MHLQKTEFLSLEHEIEDVFNEDSIDFYLLFLIEIDILWRRNGESAESLIYILS